MDNKQISYFDLDEKLQIDSFIPIPKLLFKKYSSLSTGAKFVYSLYLHRYSSTKFKNEKGEPYIIFADNELADLLDINVKTCQRAKKELVKLNLIRLEKSVSYNKIYLYRYYNSTDNKFYLTEDFEQMQFYKFPSVLLKEEFNNLNLNTKLLYAYYLDYITLSQKNRFADKYNRVYFYDDYSNQGEDLNLSTRTITNSRNTLYAAGLLFKYHHYASKVRYYLKKVTSYDKDSLITYIELDDKHKKEYLKKINKEQMELIGKNVAIDIEEKENMSLSNNSEKMSLAKPKKSLHQESKDVSTKTQNNENEFGKKDSHIIYTELKETNLNNSLINYIKEFKKYTNSLMIHETRREFIIALLDKLESSPRFIIKRPDKDGNKRTCQLEANDIANEFSKIKTEFQFGTLFNTTIDKIERKGYRFSSPESQLNCLLTFILNELMDNENLNHLEKPSWFNAFTYVKPSSHQSHDEFDEDIKNLKWWEE